MLLFILSAYNSLYLLTLNSHSIPLSPTLPTGNHRSVLVSGSLFLFVQFSSVAQSCLTLCDPVDCSMPDFSVHHQTPEFTHKLMSIESVMPSNHLILCRPLLLPPVFPSTKVFSNESVLWSFSVSISPSNEY